MNYDKENELIQLWKSWKNNKLNERNTWFFYWTDVLCEIGISNYYPILDHILIHLSKYFDENEVEVLMFYIRKVANYHHYTFEYQWRKDYVYAMSDEKNINTDSLSVINDSYEVIINQEKELLVRMFDNSELANIIERFEVKEGSFSF